MFLFSLNYFSNVGKSKPHRSTKQGKGAWNVSSHGTKGTDTREFNLKTCQPKRSINPQVEITHIHTHMCTHVHTHLNTYIHMCIDMH